MQSSDTSAGVRIGEVLAGKYRVDGILGAGGMGVVVAAHHLQLDERVALKFLLPAALGNTEAMARFQREARAAVKIKSEHVARVIDVGTLETGAPYIVMEFLEGQDLAAWLLDKGPLAVEQAVEFVLQACEAIAEAHSLGIIHRDLKPANLFVVRRNDGAYSVKVLDFGISKVTSLSGPDMAGTRTSAVMGSPFYMSPEQMRSSKDVNPQSDIWTLGVILFELLSGQSPFFGETFPEVCLKITNEPPPSLRSVRPDSPVGLEVAIGKCLEKDRARRYKDVSELASALQEFAPARAKASVERIFGILQSGLTATGRSGTVSDSNRDLPASGTIAPFGRTTRGLSRRTKSTALAGLVCALVVGVGAMLFYKHASSRSPEGPAYGAMIPAQPLPAPSRVASPPVVDPVASVVVLPPPPPDRATSAPPAEASSKATMHAPALRRAPSAQPPSVTTAALPPALPPAPPTGAGTTSTIAAPAPSGPRAAPTTNCDPPFYFDADGIRVFKKECVR